MGQYGNGHEIGRARDTALIRRHLLHGIVDTRNALVTRDYIARDGIIMRAYNLLRTQPRHGVIKRDYTRSRNSAAEDNIVAQYCYARA